MLTHFELEAPGFFHCITLLRMPMSRGDEKTGFVLEYAMTVSVLQGSRRIVKYLPLFTTDAISVKARHDKIIEQFSKEVA